VGEKSRFASDCAIFSGLPSTTTFRPQPPLVHSRVSLNHTSWYNRTIINPIINSIVQRKVGTMENHRHEDLLAIFWFLGLTDPRNLGEGWEEEIRSYLRLLEFERRIEQADRRIEFLEQEEANAAAIAAGPAPPPQEPPLTQHPRGARHLLQNQLPARRPRRRGRHQRLQ
jgi:hypothetical protein